MKIDTKTLIDALERCPNLPVYVETCESGLRSEQRAFDVLIGKDKILIASEAAMNAGDLEFLPTQEKH